MQVQDSHPRISKYMMHSWPCLSWCNLDYASHDATLIMPLMMQPWPWTLHDATLIMHYWCCNSDLQSVLEGVGKVKMDAETRIHLVPRKNLSPSFCVCKGNSGSLFKDSGRGFPLKAKQPGSYQHLWAEMSPDVQKCNSTCSLLQPPVLLVKAAHASSGGELATTTVMQGREPSLSLPNWWLTMNSHNT